MIEQLLPAGVVAVEAFEDVPGKPAFPGRGGRCCSARTSGDMLRELKGHGDQVRGAAFSADGARIVTASDDGTARVWDAASGEKTAQSGTRPTPRPAERGGMVASG